jgi:DNA-binding MarR family transcriptional regulator
VAKAPARDTLELANRLRPALLLLNRCLRREEHGLGITGGQAILLGKIKRFPEYSVSELASSEGLSIPAMTRYLDRLQNAGLITRVRSDEDARKLRLQLTSEGERALQLLRSARTAWLASRLGELTPQELDEIDAAIEPLLRLVDER